MTIAVEELDPTVVELLATIDAFMADIRHQTMIDTSRVIDFALDLRLILGKETV